MPTILVTGAGGNIGTNIIRGLRDTGSEFSIIGIETNMYYHHLSLADNTYRAPHAIREKNEYTSFLQDVCDGTVDLIIPTNVAEIRTLSSIRSELPTRVALPASSVIEVFLDKYASYQSWTQAEVPVPETHLIENPSDIEVAVGSIPSNQYWVRGAGVKTISPVPGRSFKDPTIIEDWIRHHDGWGEFTVSTYLPGRDCTWLGLYSDGKLIGCQSRERVDYSVGDLWGSGAPSVSTTINDDTVHELGKAAVEAVAEQPDGVFFSDMRGDVHGQLRVTEVNPGRLGTTSSAFYYQAGWNVVADLVAAELDTGRFDSPKISPIEPDLYFIRKLDCEPVVVRGEDIHE